MNGVIRRIKCTVGELEGLSGGVGNADDNKVMDVENISRWQPLGEGWVKLNCEAYNLQLERVVVGVIDRDENANILARVERIVHSDELEVAKALAIKTRIKLAKEQVYHKIVLEYDS